ncbi:MULTISPECIES: hypothetical protein [Alkalihalophilus]|uniref:Uncharacterized protein n=1 Tax=Alkalihalophilus pseudofirmus (strain ATCC BAA-2126 / JCM 17055 / OF4) TaxID=398511 RepID=D3G1C9_ALKPO|nr:MULTISPECIES: hypothetical protein [Alkalihalophilus]ADC52155.1 hypothetical protein BpOF4_20799 [Alkalihalophilus pseudofirmus OF4]MEC2074206.1 hypothetical protein [Alkalihalophilus marmarensis]
MKAICTDSEGSLQLIEGKEYFIFPHGDDHVYVSKFDNKSSHFGAYRKELFKVTDRKDTTASYPTSEELGLKKGVIYKVRKVPGVKALSLTEEIHYAKCRKTHALVYRDRDCTRLCGQYPLVWLSDYEELYDNEPEPVIEETPEVLIETKKEWIQTTLF